MKDLLYPMAPGNQYVNVAVATIEYRRHVASASHRELTRVNGQRWQQHLARVDLYPCITDYLTKRSQRHIPSED